MSLVLLACRVAACALLLACTASCSPALNWRELRLPDTELVATFPCKPDQLVRRLPLAGQVVRMEMATCSANGLTFAVAHADLPDPLVAERALEEMHTGTKAHFPQGVRLAGALHVPGMTPHLHAERLHGTGHRPDGSVLEEESAPFLRGRRVYQATVVGDHVTSEAAEIFFTALRFAP